MQSRSDRDALVEKHREYARALTLKIARDLPRFVARDDLIAVGIEGLVEAATRFDPTRGAQFTTFAYYRVRGAVYDHIRRLANADPYLRARASGGLAVDSVVEGALAERPRAATDGPAEAAEALSSVLDAVATAFTVTQCAEALVAEGAQTDTEDAAAKKQSADVLRVAVARLPEKERTMVAAVYFEGTTIEEAGATMGLSKSWASRLHARALAMLREQLPQLDE